MLQVHAGSIWIGQKIVEKVREHSQTTMRRNLFVRMTLDKVSNRSFSKKKCVDIPPYLLNHVLLSVM